MLSLFAVSVLVCVSPKFGARKVLSFKGCLLCAEPVASASGEDAISPAKNHLLISANKAEYVWPK